MTQHKKRICTFQSRFYRD